MFYLMVTTCFKDVVETDKVALDISIRIGDAIANTCLSCKVYYNRDIIFSENLFYGFLVGDRGVNKSPTRAILSLIETGFYTILILF